MNDDEYDSEDWIINGYPYETLISYPLQIHLTLKVGEKVNMV